MGALLLSGTLVAQTPVPEWQAGVDKVKSLIKTNPEQASETAGELLKGKNKKNVSLVVSVARAYLDAGKPAEAENYLKAAKKADSKDASVSVLEGDIALAGKDVGRACQLYEQAIYFNPDCKEAYLKYARAYKLASPSQAIDKLQQLKSLAPDYLEADKELAGVYYATNRFGKAAETYAKFIDTPVATEDDILKYAFALFLNHDFEKSLEVVRKGLQKNGRHAAFNRLAMYNYTDLKRYDEAEQAANAFFNASDNADYSYLDYRYYGALLSALKKYDQAVAEYGKALEKDSDQVDIWREIADAYELKNDYAQAITAYQKYYDALSQDKKTAESLFQLGRLYYGQGTSSDTLSVRPADRVTALQAADSVFALVARQAPDSYLGDMWRARTNSAIDPETTEGLAKPYYEKVAEMLLAKNEPRYNSALIECYSYLGYYYFKSAQNRSAYQTLRDVYDTPTLIAPAGYPSGYSKDFAALWELNPDTVGWISIDGTALDYPVVQTTDNTKYYRMNFEGEYSEHAVPFVDASDDLQKPSTNVIVYGHNIRTDGQMFNILKGYTDLSFYQEHSVIDFNSVYHDGQYKIISVFYTNTHAEHGKIFPYHEFIDAQDAQQTQDYIDSVLVRSIINTGVDVRSDDQLLTLSTCSYEFKDARFVVVARKVRKGESASVDTSAAVMNPNPLYPDVWYQLFGGSKPDEAQLKAALHSAS